jgi:alpha-D-xyloside xylohydrolase
MKLLLQYSLFTSIALLAFSIENFAQQKKYVQTENELIVHPDVRFSGGVQSVRLRVVSNKIIGIKASVQKEALPDKSLIVIPQANKVQWKVEDKGVFIELITALLKIKVSLASGAVSFYDVKDKLLLAEKQADGRTIQPVILEGEKLYALRQTFETTNEDAYYGLGQHQDDSWNYKGRQIVFFQNNTEVAFCGIIILTVKSAMSGIFSNCPICNCLIKMVMRDGSPLRMQMTGTSPLNCCLRRLNQKSGIRI